MIGRTFSSLAAAGVDAKSIDVVLISHLHPDHTNGIRAADNSMTFPNAEIMVPAGDWAFWKSEENAAKAESNKMMKDYFANVRKIYSGIENKVTKYEWGKEVVPGITSIATPGHASPPASTAPAPGSGLPAAPCPIHGRDDAPYVTETETMSIATPSTPSTPPARRIIPRSGQAPLRRARRSSRRAGR